MRCLGVVIAPLLSAEVVEGRGHHVARWALPVCGHRPLLPTIHWAQLFLADVVCPAATVDTLGATHRGQRQKCAVDGIRVEVVVNTSTHNDLGAAFRIRGILRELAADTDSGIGWHTG